MCDIICNFPVFLACLLACQRANENLLKNEVFLSFETVYFFIITLRIEFECRTVLFFQLNLVVYLLV